jgi:hypothetical protein
MELSAEKTLVTHEACPGRHQDLRNEPQLAPREFNSRIIGRPGERADHSPTRR